MERQSLHHQERDHLAEPLIPSLLQRLSSQEKAEVQKIPLQERLSNRLRPLLNRLGRDKSRSHKPSLRSRISLKHNQEVTSSSSPSHLIDMSPPLIESRPSLLSRMNVEQDLPTPSSESERRMIKDQVTDMRNLTGIFPMSYPPSTSTTSLIDFPERVNQEWEGMIPEEDQTQIATQSQNQMTNRRNED